MDQIPFLKKNVATEMKGIAAIYIMLSHLVSSPWWWMGFFLFGGGYLFVGVFFFYSGYGLKKSIRNNPHYLDGFLRKKIANIYFPFLIAEICYTLLTAYYNNDYTGLILRCVGFQLSNSMLWYVVEILAMYILFYLFEKRHVPMIGYGIVWIIFSAFASITDLGSWWYVSSPCFIFGLVCGKYEEKIKVIKGKRRKIGIFCIFLATDFLHRIIAEYKIGFHGIPSTYICVALMIVAVLLFVAALLTIVGGRTSKFRLSEIIGNNSYYIYLWHGFFICLYSHYIRDSKLVAICVVATTMLFSLLYGRIKESVSYKKMSCQRIEKV